MMKLSVHIVVLLQAFTMRVLDVVLVQRVHETPRGTRAGGAQPANVRLAGEREVLAGAKLVAAEVVQLFEVEVPRFVAQLEESF